MSSATKRRVLYASPVVTLLVLMIGGKFWLDGIQSRADGVAQAGRSVITLLKEYGTGIQESDATKIAACYDDNYHADPGGQWIRTLRSERDEIRIYDWKEEGSGEQTKDEVVSQLETFLADIESVELVKFKLGKIESLADDGSVRARSVLWVRGRNHDGEALESFQHFRMALKRYGDDLRIVRQELLRGELVVGKREGFVEVTEAAGIDFRAHYNPDWFDPEWAPERFGIVKYANSGVSAADYDGDGHYDLYFADGEQPRLYRNLGGGDFVDVTVAAGLPEKLNGVNTAIFADLDNDGDKDLFVTRMTAANRLYRNDGDGTFTDVTEGAGLSGELVAVAAAADYDLDGDLDLYLGRYLDPRVDLPTTLFYTRNSAGNSLLRNDGNLQFVDVTEEAGVREGGLTLSVSWADVDSDGDPDLYVANDFGRNALLRNDGANAEGKVTFTDVSFDSDAIDFGFGMSSSFGDVDADGDFDLYVSNVHSGQRWYGQATTLRQYLYNSVRQGTFFEDWSLYREIFGFLGDDWAEFGDRMVKGNSLLLNNGKGEFTDVGEAANANPFGWYWTSVLFDYDNDGQLDAYAANGWISGKTYDDL